MPKWLICLFKGHKWGYWALMAPGEADTNRCEYTKCGRCGKYKDNGEEVKEQWINA